MRMSRERLFGLAERIVGDLAATEGVALDLEHGITHRLATPRERFLELGLVVDMAVQRIVDPSRERLHDRLLDLLETVLEEEGRLEETIDQEVRKTLSSYSRPAPEGSSEWEVLYNKTREEVYKRRLRL